MHEDLVLTYHTAPWKATVWQKNKKERQIMAYFTKQNKDIRETQCNQ